MSRTRPLATAVLAAALVAACATTTSPTGRTQYVGAVSQAQLDQLGAKAFAEQKASKPQASDAAQRRYVACVTDSIVAGLPAQWRAYRWESAVFVDDEPNAFALPGGKVGVYTGIFRVARDQDQLAAVIAHEVGHVMSGSPARWARPVRSTCWERWRAITGKWPRRVARSWPRPGSCCRIRVRRKAKPTWSGSD